MARFTVLLLVMFGYGVGARAEPWQTTDTAHFTIRYPKSLAAVAQQAAQQLELSVDSVWQQQQRQLAHRGEVLIVDPLNAANGLAVPLTYQPTMVLFATPPQSDSILHFQQGWLAIVALHEYVHLVHLSQPVRSDWRDQLSHAWPWFDLYKGLLPRWVSEGYATLQESALSGQGRIHSSYAEAWLQQLALEGALPSYGELSAHKGRYQAGGFAYLQGGRFLAWLQQQFGVAAVDQLWTRLAAGNRDFENAFSGWFGVSAASLYQRFVAEYGFQAMAQQQQLAPLSATLWHNNSGQQLNPALSADGSQLVLVTENDREQLQLQVLAVADNVAGLQQWQQQRRTQLQHDPADALPAAPVVINHQILHSRSPVNGLGVRNPKWWGNGKVIFGADSLHCVGEPACQRRQDLQIWDLATDQVNTLTTGAGLRRFDVSLVGDFVIAERQQNGFGQLVKVSLPDGQLTSLTEPELGSVFDYPAIAPDQSQLAVLHFQSNQGWQLELRDLQGALQHTVALPNYFDFISYLTWQPDSQALWFVASSDVNSRLALYRYLPATDQLWQHSTGAELPQQLLPLPNGEFLLQLVNQQGPDLYRVDGLLNRGRLVDRSQTRVAFSLANALHQASVASVVRQTTPNLNTSPMAEQTEPHTAVVQPAAPALSVRSTADNSWQLANTVQWQFGNQQPDILALGFKAGSSTGLWDVHVGLAHAVTDASWRSAFVHGQWHSDAWLWQAGWFVSQIAENQSEFQRQQWVYGRASYRYQSAFGSWQPSFAIVGVAQRPNDAALTATLMQGAVTQRWRYQTNDWGLSVEHYLGYLQQVSDDRSGVDWALNYAGRWQELELALGFGQWQRFAGGQLVLGGIDSAFSPLAQQPDWLAIPELSFASVSTRQLRHQQLRLGYQPWQPWSWRINRYQLPDRADYFATGLHYDNTLGLALGPISLRDVRIQAGLMAVWQQQHAEDYRYWLSVGYRY